MVLIFMVMLYMVTILKMYGCYISVGVSPGTPCGAAYLLINSYFKDSTAMFGLVANYLKGYNLLTSG